MNSSLSVHLRKGDHVGHGFRRHDRSESPEPGFCTFVLSFYREAGGHDEVCIFDMPPSSARSIAHGLLEYADERDEQLALISGGESKVA